MTGVKRQQLIAGGLGATLSIGLFVSALAQDADTSRYRLSVSQGLKWNSNPDFSTAGSDDAFLGTSQLEFGLAEKNSIHSFALSVGGGVEYELDGSDSRWLNPNVNLSYDRVTQDSRFGIVATAVRTPLSDVTLDDDFDEDDLRTGDANRDDLRLSLSLETGLRARFGTTWSLQGRERIYSAGTFSDTTTRDASATFRFDWTRQIQTRLRFGYQDFNTDSTTTNDKRTTSVTLNNRFQLDKISAIDAGISYTRVEESGTASADDQEGVSYTLSYDQQMSDGSITLGFADRFQETGRQRRLTIGRAFERKWGSISGTVGVSRNSSGDLQPLYTLALSREGKTSRLTVSFNQQINVSSDDEDVLRSALNLAFTQQINRQSSLSAQVSGQNSRNLDSDTDTGRLSGSVTYRHDLGSDWGIATGVSHTSVFRDSDSDTERNEVFLRLEKDFNWR